MWMKQLKNDPVHKKIMQIRQAFMENGDFNPEEAMEAAVDNRKFLIKRLLKDYNFTEGSDADDEDDQLNRYFDNLCNMNRSFLEFLKCL